MRGPLLYPPLPPVAHTGRLATPRHFPRSPYPPSRFWSPSNGSSFLDPRSLPLDAIVVPAGTPPPGLPRPSLPLQYLPEQVSYTLPGMSTVSSTIPPLITLVAEDAAAMERSQPMDCSERSTESVAKPDEDYDVSTDVEETDSHPVVMATTSVSPEKKVEETPKSEDVLLFNLLKATAQPTQATPEMAPVDQPTQPSDAEGMEAAASLPPQPIQAEETVDEAPPPPEPPEEREERPTESPVDKISLLQRP